MGPGEGQNWLMVAHQLASAYIGCFRATRRATGETRLTGPHPQGGEWLKPRGLRQVQTVNGLFHWNNCTGHHRDSSQPRAGKDRRIERPLVCDF